MSLVWLSIAFVAGTFFGIFGLALGQAAARGDRREFDELHTCGTQAGADETRTVRFARR